MVVLVFRLKNGERKFRNPKCYMCRQMIKTGEIIICFGSMNKGDLEWYHYNCIRERANKAKLRNGTLK